MFALVFLLFLIMCLYGVRHVCVCVCVPMEARAIRFPRAGVKGGCALPDVGAGSQTWVLWENNTLSQLLRHLPS